MASLASSLKTGLLRQASTELKAYILYQQGSCWFSHRHLDGISKRLKQEAEEEKKHFESILDYLVIRKEPVKIEPPQIPSTEFGNEVQAFQFYLDLEKQVHGDLHQLYLQARETSDFDTERFLGPYLDEQIRSVDEWEKLVEQVKSFSTFHGLIWHLDSII